MSGFGVFVFVLCVGVGIVQAFRGEWMMVSFDAGLAAWVATDLYNDWRRASPGEGR